MGCTVVVGRDSFWKADSAAVGTLGELRSDGVAVEKFERRADVLAGVGRR